MPIDEGFKGTGNTNVPVPDPSLLTTQQLREGIDNLKEIVYTRLDAMDHATDLRLEMFRKLPSEIDAKVEHLNELTVSRFNLESEKFKGIAQQFHERDVRTTQASGAADDALKAALQAAKELVGAQGEASAAAAVKSETSFTKQIDQIGTIIQTLEKALDARITELKERIDRGEGTVSGGREVIQTRRLDSSFAISVITAIFLFISVGTGIILAITHK